MQIIFKIQFTTLLIIMTASMAVGQEKALSPDSDTTFWLNYYKNCRNKIGLEAIDKIDNEFYFRFWDGNKVIELRQNEDRYIGTVTFLLQQVKNNKEGSLFFRKTSLTDKSTNQIIEMLTRYGINGIPTDKLIRGWEGGLDGIVYITEFADQKNYSFKNYWSPELYQDSIPEAKRLMDFITKLNEIEELKVLEQKFMARQPFSCWYTFIGSSTICVKVY
jgi:hypothetical protein